MPPDAIVKQQRVLISKRQHTLLLFQSSPYFERIITKEIVETFYINHLQKHVIKLLLKSVFELFPTGNN